MTSVSYRLHDCFATCFMTGSYRLHARRARQISQVDESYAQSQPADRLVHAYMYMSVCICLCQCPYVYVYFYTVTAICQYVYAYVYIVTFFVRMVFDVMSIRQRMAEPVWSLAYCLSFLSCVCVGAIPVELGKLTNVTCLCLGYNRLTGSYLHICVFVGPWFFLFC